MLFPFRRDRKKQEDAGNDDVARLHTASQQLSEFVSAHTDRLHTVSVGVIPPGGRALFLSMHAPPCMLFLFSSAS